MSLDLIIYILISAAAAVIVGVIFSVLQKRKSEPEKETKSETASKSEPEKESAPVEKSPEAPIETALEKKKPKFSLANIFSSSKNLDNIYEELSNTLVSADMGTGLTAKVLEKIKETKPKTADDVKQTAKNVLVDILKSKSASELDGSESGNAKSDNISKPAIYLFVGVNGVGKTTTLGKIGKKASDEGKKVVYAAADTFRAAASEQLTTWSQAAGAQIVKEEGADPASIAYKAVDLAKKDNYDAVFVDTAGRLHNKANLIEELKKVVRVIEKLAPITQTYLVLDAMTGQNGLQQAKVFREAVNISGVVLTKMDGTAKGGVIFSIQSQIGVPVKWIGLGEGSEDLIEFSPVDFVNSILD
ncbi:MAG: signal recognition particle-docking protein FtsY [Bifidobacteriaceae bacterium]|jgi:fused signal recognition particle receptor|nr:signal recognition particle-docking protein FtsY [Bifidobacteriaceae bacterium]